MPVSGEACNLQQENPTAGRGLEMEVKVAVGKNSWNGLWASR